MEDGRSEHILCGYLHYDATENHAQTRPVICQTTKVTPMKSLPTHATNPTKTSPMRAIQLGVLGVSGLLIGLSGCVSYTNVPVPASAPAFESANHWASISVITEALSTIIAKHPPKGEYVINLPAGTTPETFGKIIAELPVGAIMPYEGMNTDLPVYHIGRVWIRASDAKVDVIYPFTGYDGAKSDQNVTVWLNGGVRRWRAFREQSWSAGTIPTPPMYYPIVEEYETDSAMDSGMESDMDTNEADTGSMESMNTEAAPAPTPTAVPTPAPSTEPSPTETGNGYRQVPLDS